MISQTRSAFGLFAATRTTTPKSDAKAYLSSVSPNQGCLQKRVCRRRRSLLAMRSRPNVDVQAETIVERLPFRLPECIQPRANAHEWVSRQFARRVQTKHEFLIETEFENFFEKLFLFFVFALFLSADALALSDQT
jgi:hypothetical protein